MKLKILQCVFISAVIAAAGLTTYFSRETITIPKTTLENIEALADAEVHDGYQFVYYPQPGDANYGNVLCVCGGGEGPHPCCY